MAELPAWRLPVPEAVLVAVGFVLAWLSGTHPLLLPAWAPWDFNWPAWLGIGLSLVWFGRGYRMRAADRPSAWRCVSFLAGLALLYAVLLTRFDYLAQHMFFLNRVQHAVLHHMGPFLIALSWPGTTIAQGMPRSLRRLCRHPLLQSLLRVLRQPLLAAFLFEGLLLFWLLPPAMFRAMFDWRVYALMNASMTIDGLLFWFLVLDPRPAPAAPIGFFARLCLAFLIIFPQIVAGTIISLVPHDLYPSFALCGRVYPEISPLLDQQIGSLILWVPAGMMSAIASLIVMARMFHHEDAANRIGVIAQAEVRPA